MSNVAVADLPKAVHEFRPKCPGCTPERAMAPGGKPCSFYDCPGLPEELRVTCDSCMFDFAAAEGQIKCDHSTCEIALRLKKNVETYKAWVRLIKTEAAS